MKFSQIGPIAPVEENWTLCVFQNQNFDLCKNIKSISLFYPKPSGCKQKKKLTYNGCFGQNYFKVYNLIYRTTQKTEICRLQNKELFCNCCLCFLTCYFTRSYMFFCGLLTSRTTYDFWFPLGIRNSLRDRLQISLLILSEFHSSD